MDRIWMVEFDEYDNGWTTHGLFTTKELAEKYVADALTDKEREHERSEFRIDWLPLDTPYEFYEETDFEIDTQPSGLLQ